MTLKHPCIAYLVSEYPAISHTFIYREIQAMRDRGASVYTVSIRPTEHLEQMTKKEQREADQTLYVKTASLPAIALSHLRLLWHQPRSYMKMLTRALRINRDSLHHLFKAMAYFIEAGIVLDWMQRYQVKHLHVHFANPAASVALIVQAYGTVSYSLSVHGPDVFFNVQANALVAKFKEATFIRCISHYCCSQVSSFLDIRHWNKISLVRCGVNSKTFAPRPEPDNPTLEILCVGRLVPVKGQHVLLQSCARLMELGYPFHLTLVGDGPDLLSLQEHTSLLGLKNQVTFTGAVGQEAVHVWYNQANLFVLPSFAEGIPVVLMEAMSKTIACISTRITGIPELIEHGRSGLLCTPGDVEDLAGCMRILMDSLEYRRTLGLQARERVRSLYSLTTNCQNMASLFERHLVSKESI